MNKILSEKLRNDLVDMVSSMKWEMEHRYKEYGHLDYSDVRYSVKALSDKYLVKMLGQFIEPLEDEENFYPVRLYREAAMEIAFEEEVLGNK